MGLFSSKKMYCTVCSGEANKNDAQRCGNCGAVTHNRCLKRSGNAMKKSRLIRSDKVKLRCPNCGNVGSI
ncbi:hypothetical protein [Natronomonas sp. EA1]|uniref:hypothetical protein n=1 Tax=Natronomonas sp. EA1 TaxID=3421655 RepID=UPI003EB9DF04